MTDEKKITFLNNFNIHSQSEVDWMLQLRVDVSFVLHSITVQILFSSACLHLWLNTSYIWDFKTSVLSCSCKDSSIGLLSVNKFILTYGMKLLLCLPPVAQKVS